MRCAKAGERLAAVSRFKEAFSAGVNDIGVRGIRAERAVVKRTLDECALRVDECPRLTGVFGAIQTTAGLGFDERIDSIWIRICDGEIGFADQLVGKASGDLRKVFAAVDALVETSF